MLPPADVWQSAQPALPPLLRKLSKMPWMAAPYSTPLYTGGSFSILVQPLGTIPATGNATNVVNAALAQASNVVRRTERAITRNQDCWCRNCSGLERSYRGP